MINWHLEVLPIKDLIENPKNPRQISKFMVSKLQNSLKRFGLIDKPILNKDLSIIGGHQRIKVLKKMKAKNVECWVPDRLLDEEELEELCIGLNLYQGSWDWDIMANQWDPINLLKYGFSEEQIMGEFEKVEEIEGEESPKSKKKPKVCPNCSYEF